MIHLSAGSGYLAKLFEAPITNDFRYRAAAGSGPCLTLDAGCSELAEYGAGPIGRRNQSLHLKLKLWSVSRFADIEQWT